MRGKVVGSVLLLSLFFVGTSMGKLELKSISGTGSGKGGLTEVAKGNSKGQTIALENAGSLSGVVLQVGDVSAANDLKLSIFAMEGGAPVGDALYSDSGTLPAGLAKGASLRMDFASSVELPAGAYVLVFATDSSKLRFRLDNSDPYPAGRLIRKKDGGAWSAGAGKSNDFIFELIGAVDTPSAKPVADTATQPASRSVDLNRVISTNVRPLRERLPKQPNIVTVMVDDLGWNQLSVPQSTMGTHRAEYATPNVEFLANKGLSFTHAYSQPNCAPTRAAMLSGQYPARIHNDVYIVGNLNRNGKGGKSGISKAEARFVGPAQTEDVAAAAITVAEALKQNGYATAHIGKYHVGGHDGGEATLPKNVGFDINVGGNTQGHQTTCFSSLDKASGKWVFKKLGDGAFDKYAAPYTKAYVERYDFATSLVGTPKHVSDAVGDAMEDTIATFSAAGKPFYLQLHPYAVHGPVKARPDLKEAAGGDNFAGFVASVDLIVGRLLKAIADPNGDGNTNDSIAANTLILFTSDNGGTHDNGDNLPLRGKKGMFTEGGMRVPLIAYWPGVIPANTVTDRMVHSVDYYPTYLALAGNRWTPPENEHPLDGESFAAFLLKPDHGKKREPIFYLFPGYMDSRAQPCAVVIDESAGKRFKLLYFYEADAWELYNLTDDIGEAENVVNQHPELASTLSKKINAWLGQKHLTWKPKYPLEKESGKPVGLPPIL